MQELEYLRTLDPNDKKIIYPGVIKFMYSEKATKFCEISTVDLSYVVPIKSTAEIFQNDVAFSEYMNFEITYETLELFAALLIITSL